MSRNIKALSFNDNKYYFGKSLFTLIEERLNLYIQKKTIKKNAENVPRDFQFHCFLKFQSLLLIGQPWFFRFLKKILVLTF